MPMIQVETVKAVQELLQERGIEQRECELWGDYVARGLGVSAGKAEAFLEALHSGGTVAEAKRVAGIHEPGKRALIEAARAVGTALGKVSRQVVPNSKSSRPTGRSGWNSTTQPEHSPGSNSGATEDQVNMAATLPERIDAYGTKAEDLAGTGGHDSQGG